MGGVDAAAPPPPSPPPSDVGEREGGCDPRCVPGVRRTCHMRLFWLRPLTESFSRSHAHWVSTSTFICRLGPKPPASVTKGATLKPKVAASMMPLRSILCY